MDASADVLAGQVRARRVAIDNDLELLRVRLQQVDPRRVDLRPWARTVVPIVAGLAAVWLFLRRRRSMRSLHDVLVYELRDLYRFDRQLVPALARMSAKASNPELRDALDQLRSRTERHIERLERVFRSIGAKPAKGGSALLAGIVDDGDRLLKRAGDGDVRDASLIATAERLAHVEIATLGYVRGYAESLGYTYAAQLLEQTLEEDCAAGEQLSRVAERFVRPDAVRRAL